LKITSAASRNGAQKAKSTVWISYDLGVRGDYENLYAWLDAHGAKECGDSLAVLTFEYKGSLADELKSELKKAFAVDKRTRVYVVYRERTTNRNKGIFLFGGRRSPAWTGYSSAGVVTEDNEI
jgi:hypothetical protein